MSANHEPLALVAQAHAAPVQASRRRRRKQRYTRSRSGCLTCRRRKVKCDEAKPTCAKCDDLEKECVWAAEQPFEFRLVHSQVRSHSHSHSHSRSRSRSQSISASSTQSESPKPAKRINRALEDVNLVTIQARDETAWAARKSTRMAEGGVSKAAVVMSSAPPVDLPCDVDIASFMAEALTDRSTVSPHSTSDRVKSGAWAPPASTAVTETRVESWLDQLASQAISTAALPEPPMVGSSAEDSSPSSEEEGSVLDLMREQQSQLLAIGSGSGLPGSMIDPSVLLLGAGQPLFSGLTSTSGRISINPGTTSSSYSTPFANLPTLAHASQPSFNMSASTLAMRRGVVPQFGSSMMLHPAADPIAAAYPSENGRRLFNHFCSLTSIIVIAMGTKHKDKGKNPFLGVSIPLIVSDVDSPAQTALRLGVLSLAATHLHHQYIEAGGTEQAAQMYEETQSAKRQAIAHMMLSLSKEGDRHIDLLLAACMTLKTRDILLADKTWKKNLDFALRLITKRGGPAALIAEEPHNFQRRFVVEQLLTTEVVSTFSTGDEPMFLGAPSAWWSEFRTSATSEWHWEAYEYQFGISRAMIQLIARVRVLVYRKQRLADLTDPSASSTISALLDALDTDARALIDELKAYSLDQMYMAQRGRVRLGDTAYRYAMLITLLTEVLGTPAGDERVQMAVRSVLELCSETSQEPVMLQWPLLIASSRAPDTDRGWVKDLFGVFKRIHCSDLVVAEKLVLGQWARIDSGKGWAPWHVLMKEMELEVLLI